MTRSTSSLKVRSAGRSVAQRSADTAPGEPGRGLDDRSGLDDQRWSIGRFHAASVEVVRDFKILVDFGVLRAPRIHDATGRLNPSPTLAEAASFLQGEPNAVVFLRWSVSEAPLLSRLEHAWTGNTLPLRPAEKLAHLRQRLGDVRVVWLAIAGPENRELRPGLNLVADEVFALAATLRRVREIDPTLAILTAPDGEYKALAAQRATDDARRVAAELEQIHDIAVWDRDFRVASRLLDETRGYIEQRIEIGMDGAAAAVFPTLLAGTERMRAALEADAQRFAADVQDSSWRQMSPRAYSGLASLIGGDMVVQVPGEVMTRGTPDEKLEILVQGVGIQDRHASIAPWLYGLEVAVLQPVALNGPDATIAVTGLPIALVDTVSGQRRVRRLLHDESEIPDVELSVASFLNLKAGTYRIELVQQSPKERFGAYNGPSTGGPFLGKVGKWIQSRFSQWRGTHPPMNRRLTLSAA